MTKRTLLLPMLLIGSSPNKAPQVVAIEHVSVLPMDGRQVLADQTVLVRGEAIDRVGPAGRVTVPPGAIRIDGKGKYLMPGMADMHVHPYDTDGMASYLAYGVTTIAVMHGSPPVLEWRERVKRGELPGPTIYTAGPSINGYPPANPLFVSVETPEEARAVVQEQKAAGYDFLKVYSMLNPSEHAAIVAEARRLGMPVFGHIPFQVGWRATLESGQDVVAHVEEFFNSGIQDSDFVAAAELAKRKGTAVTANLYAYSEMLRESADIPRLLADPEMRFHSPAGLDEKLPSSNRSQRQNQADFNAFLMRQQPRMRRLVKLLVDTGVPVFPGTDTETFGFPGQSLLGELDDLLLAGLTPYQVLDAATRLPGEFIAKKLGERFGTVTVGSRADLVLLDANPLENLANLKLVRGTLARGRWYPIERIAQIRDSIAARNLLLHPLVKLLDSLAMKANDGPAALALFQRIRREFPDAVPVAELSVRGYGRTIFLKGDKPSAVKLREQVAALFARSHSAENEVGRGYLFSGDTSSALLHFRKSLALSPHNSAVQRMVDKLEDSRSALEFEPNGRWVFEPVLMHEHQPGTSRALVLTIADSAGKRMGHLLWEGKEVAVDELVVGGQGMWVTTDVGGQTLELKLRVAGDLVTGVWTYGWGNNGPLVGKKG